jgi:hypothetical protein
MLARRELIVVGVAIVRNDVLPERAAMADGRSRAEYFSGWRGVHLKHRDMHDDGRSEFGR